MPATGRKFHSVVLAFDVDHESVCHIGDGTASLNFVQLYVIVGHRIYAKIVFS